MTFSTGNFSCAASPLVNVLRTMTLVNENRCMGTSVKKGCDSLPEVQEKRQSANKSPRHRLMTWAADAATPGNRCAHPGASGLLHDGLLASRGALFERALQAVAGDVQAALDGADRSLELAGHLLQGLTL